MKYIEMSLDELDCIKDRDIIYAEFINNKVYTPEFCFKKHKIIYDMYHKSFVDDNTFLHGGDFCTKESLEEDIGNGYAKIYKLVKGE